MFSKSERNNLILLADKYHKYKSGGTDYYALNKPNILIGSDINNNVHIDKSLIEDWIDKVSLI